MTWTSSLFRIPLLCTPKEQPLFGALVADALKKKAQRKARPFAGPKG